MTVINVSDEALKSVITSLSDATDEVLSYYAKLENFITEVTSGGITGDPANQIQAKFSEKKPTFDALKKALTEAKDKMDAKKTQFGSLMSDMSSNLR